MTILCFNSGLSQTGSRVGGQTRSGSAVTLTERCIETQCLEWLPSVIGHVYATKMNERTKIDPVCKICVSASDFFYSGPFSIRVTPTDKEIG